MTYKERVEGVLDGYKNYVVESMTLQATDVSNKKINKHQATQQIINLIESVIPEEIDVKSKYETDDDGGIIVVVDENNDTMTGENLVHLARLASDEGYNQALTDMRNKLRDGE